MNQTMKKSRGVLPISDERLIYAMQLLGDKSRFKIFKLLIDSEDKCVGEIADELGISLSAVSQHFRNYEMIGIVDKQRTGQKICYMLKKDDRLVQELIDLVSFNSNKGE
jgi:ArsR family transcriptional regulator, arsenate/arsenite/antimonite-responsive transcriptional repressor